MNSLFDITNYQFHLPEELIAQFPVSPRDSSRLMVIDKNLGSIREVVFSEIDRILNPGDCLVFNNTKVIPARIYGKLATGGNAEVLLVREMEPKEGFSTVWKALVRPGKKLKTGSKIYFSQGAFCEVLDVYDEGERLLAFEFPHSSFEMFLEEAGEMPLPHYIRRDSKVAEDTHRYQTVYAAKPGAVAAPTAGLHFTPELFDRLEKKGIKIAFVTLHVGPGTFKPVIAQDIRDHKMHTEEFWIEPDAAELINQTTGRLIPVGTTSCRAIESAANEEGLVVPGHYNTDIFMYPGYKYKKVNNLITNFHLPGSSLIMLVSSLLGIELTREAYQKAIADKFRFYSYGDAMLIL